jgi:hypothetical protein
MYRRYEELETYEFAVSACPSLRMWGATANGRPSEMDLNFYRLKYL